jgi:hypothetical protein
MGVFALHAMRRVPVGVTTVVVMVVVVMIRHDE